MAVLLCSVVYQVVSRRSVEPLLKYLHVLVAAFGRWILQCCPDDSLLAVDAFRRLFVHVLVQGSQAHLVQEVAKSVRRPFNKYATFETIEYYVSKEAQLLLRQACLHSFSFSSRASAAYTWDLPNPGRILLQCEEEPSRNFLETVVLALANEVDAVSVMVDDKALDRICQSLLGKGSEPPTQWWNALMTWAWSCFLSGGRRALAWDILSHVVRNTRKPIIVLIHEVDKTICGSPTRFQAFINAFGTADTSGSILETSSSSPVVIGGLAFKEAGTNLLQMKR